MLLKQDKMDIKNLKETEMSLLARKRVKFELEHPNSCTPSRISLKEQIAKKYDTKPELVAIRHVYTRFGTQKVKVIANVYQDEKTLKYLEPPKGKKSEPKKAAK